MLKITFAAIAFNQYLSFSKDKKTLAKINTLIKDIARNPTSGLGKPEVLKNDLSGCYSRRIDAKNRIVYRFDETNLEILQIGTHYEDK